MSKRQVGKLNFKDNRRWRKNVNIKGIKVEDSNPSFFIDWSMKGWLGSDRFLFLVEWTIRYKI